MSNEERIVTSRAPYERETQFKETNDVLKRDKEESSYNPDSYKEYCFMMEGSRTIKKSSHCQVMGDSSTHLVPSNIAEKSSCSDQKSASPKNVEKSEKISIFRGGEGSISDLLKLQNEREGSKVTNVGIGETDPKLKETMSFDKTLKEKLNAEQTTMYEREQTISKYEMEKTSLVREIHKKRDYITLLQEKHEQLQMQSKSLKQKENKRNYLWQLMLNISEYRREIEDIQDKLRKAVKKGLDITYVIKEIVSSKTPERKAQEKELIEIYEQRIKTISNLYAENLEEITYLKSRMTVRNLLNDKAFIFN
ncbi:hypothetical protein C0J52_24222 [Blattella germanica]|nr:hypothetical protein C0J52_24222 [Blattella germanica]